MPSAKERLSHLLVLASEGPAQRATLVGELADLVLDWPADCAAAMQKPLLSLFALTVREADDEMRARLAPRLGGHPELPLDLVNEFFLCAPAPVRREILMRNALADGDVDAETAAPDAADLVAAARERRDISQRLSAAMRIAPAIAKTILTDASAEPLAVLCKGAHLDRAAFSALALLEGAGDPMLRLGAYDSVPQRAAERLTRFWQMHYAPFEREQAAAAE